MGVEQSLGSVGEGGIQASLAGKPGCFSAARLAALSVRQQAQPAVRVEWMSLDAKGVFIQTMTADFRV
jgi:hypothetical protein